MPTMTAAYTIPPITSPVVCLLRIILDQPTKGIRNKRGHIRHPYHRMKMHKIAVRVAVCPDIFQKSVMIKKPIKYIRKKTNTCFIRGDANLCIIIESISIKMKKMDNARMRCL